MRVQKLLAAAGIGSRRAVEQWIREGRVTIGGRRVELGDRAGPADDVRLDGRKLSLAAALHKATEVLVYHKPVGEVATRSDPQGRPTVFERLPALPSGRWIVVGRLDVNTSGLLLFTTDGELAHRLMHPSTEVEREYLVRLRSEPSAAAIRALAEGVQLEDGPARFDRIAQVRGNWYRVILREGRNREVRRLWAAVGLEVSRLVRIRYGPIELPESSRPGTFRRAGEAEVERLAALRGSGRGRDRSSGRDSGSGRDPGSDRGHDEARRSKSRASDIDTPGA